MSREAATSEVAFESSSSHSKSKASSSFPSRSPSPLITARSFRKVRGANIQKLLAKEGREDEELDEFWQENKYFKDMNEPDDEDYEKESSIKDNFDSDFFSEPEEENKEFFGQEDKELKDEDRDKQKPKSHKAKRPQDLAPKKSYIHDFFTQEELLKEAAITEVHNRKSLADLVRLEEEKKKRNLFQKVETDSPKMKLIDSYKNGVHEKTLYFSDEIALETELFGIRNDPVLIVNLEEENDGPPQPQEVIKKKKYKDPKTGERFDTMEELKILRKKIQKEKRSRIKYQIKALKSLLEKKQQTLKS